MRKSMDRDKRDIMITIREPTYQKIVDRASYHGIALPWYLQFLLKNGIQQDVIWRTTAQEIRESLGITAGHYSVRTKKV